MRLLNMIVKEIHRKYFCIILMMIYMDCSKKVEFQKIMFFVRVIFGMNKLK